MLIKGKRAGEMKAFVIKVNKMKQEDAAKAIDAFCEKDEQSLYDAIRSITITIPTGYIKVTGTAAAQTNIAPIVLKGVTS